MSRSINIVGAGISGSLIAYFLRNTFKVNSSVPIKIFDKSRGVGGRLSTSRLNNADNKTIAKVDLGAQQYSFNSHEELSDQQNAILDLWKEHNLIEKKIESSYLLSSIMFCNLWQNRYNFHLFGADRRKDLVFHS